MVMGNAGTRENESGPSGTGNEGGEEYMECAPVSYHAHDPFPESMVQSPPCSPRADRSPLIFTPQVPVNPLQSSNEIMQNAKDHDGTISVSGIPSIITWNYEGKYVAIEGSWDNWKTRDLMQKSGKDFSILKLLPSGVYHYHFIVDGEVRYSPDLPLENDDFGNIYNVLDLQDSVPEALNSISGSESPSSPVSSYNNSVFTLEDFNEKVPELPPLLQQSLLDQPSSSRDESLEKPLTAVLNHLYIQKGCTGQSVATLSSTHRFRTKYVTVVLYKPLKKVKK
ncbi:hypothetical protein NMG60_11035282 [Bertholletia excelsa]